MTDQTSRSIRIAFVDISLFDDGSVRGGVLVTDIETKPFEFRVTSPIKPTQLQKILYGSSLAEYVYGQLICLPLLKQVKEKIELAVCQNDNLLMARPGLSFPFVYVKKQQPITGNEGIKTITIRSHRNYSGEQAQAEILLSVIQNKLDIFEPFERVRLALTEVHKQRIN